MQIGANTATSIDMSSMKVPPKRKGNLATGKVRVAPPADPQ